MGFFEKLKLGLQKTKESVFKQVNDIFKHFVKVDEEMLEELEEALIAADVGVDASCEIIERQNQRRQNKSTGTGKRGTYKYYERYDRRRRLA